MKGQIRHSTAADLTGLAIELTHELGNVLNGLLGMTRMLHECGVDSRQRLWLRAIDQSAQQLQRLLQRSVCRDGATGRLRRDRIDGIDLLEQIVLRHAPAAGSRGNRLVLTVHPDLPAAWRGDAGLLQQVFDNLLGNAIKYTRDGEVRVVARPSHAPEGLQVEVTDSGPGVTPGCERKIFAAGDRGDAGISDAAAGYGLGLYICRRIVTAMGGDIACTSPAAGGATFRVRIPALIEADACPPAGPRSLLLRDLDCELRLDGAADNPLETSVTAWLQRLGVAWRLSADPAGHGPRSAVRVGIRELQPPGASPGPHLRLELLNPVVPRPRSIVLTGPIIGSNLGPALLRLALRGRFRAPLPPTAPARGERG